jgi:hypothetical protein
MIPVYIVEENVNGQWRPRVVYSERDLAELWVKRVCPLELKDENKFIIEVVDGVGLKWARECD